MDGICDIRTMFQQRFAIARCVAVLFLIAGMVPAITGQCYTQDRNPYRMYGTKTSYSDIMPQGQPNDQTSVCRPTFIYLLARHGTPFPNQLEMQYMSQYLNVIRNNINSNTMCAQDINRLRAWMMPFQPADADRITEAGFAEMFQLGQRFRMRFPELLLPQYNPNQIHIQHTYMTQTRDSARGFVSALYQRYNVTMMANPRGNDPLLRFHEICNNYIQTVGSQRAQAYDTFINSQEFAQIVNAVAQRLGIPANSFTRDHLKIAWDACRYEHSILKSAPWCAAFTTPQLQAMEYARDVHDFYKRGYGNQINSDMTCNLMKDIVQHLRAAATGRQTRLAALRFGHADTIQPLFARLKLFCDPMMPTGTNRQSNINRQWRTSRISAFGSNIALLTYDCSGTTKLRVLVNEQPIIMPGCKDQLCPIATAMQALGQWADQCNFQQICGITNGANYNNPTLAIPNPFQINNPNPLIPNPVGNQAGMVGVNQMQNTQCPVNNPLTTPNANVINNPIINNPAGNNIPIDAQDPYFGGQQVPLQTGSGQKLAFNLIPVCLVTILIALKGGI